MSSLSQLDQSGSYTKLLRRRRAKFKKNQFFDYKIDYFDNNLHRQTGVKMAQRFSIFWITPLNCG